jgi:2-C-methyl-D-erythritol 2,4-cyclodiphosphate synthase
MTSSLRTGIGVDTHAFTSERTLWLAGLHWPECDGLAGFSDADVAAHAVCDALLSAAGLGDLGSHFGLSNRRYANASGATLLNQTLQILTDADYKIVNVAVLIVCNKPRISARREEASAALSTALGGAPVSVSATTTDGLGLTGEGKGISAIATALITRLT